MISKTELLPYQLKIISPYFIKDSKGVLLSSNLKDGLYNPNLNLQDKITNFGKSVLEGDIILDTYHNSLIHTHKIQALNQEFKPSTRFHDINNIIGEYKLFTYNHSSEKLLMKHNNDLIEYSILINSFE